MSCTAWIVSALFIGVAIGVAIGVKATLMLLNFGQRTGRIVFRKSDPKP